MHHTAPPLRDSRLFSLLFAGVQVIVYPLLELLLASRVCGAAWIAKAARLPFEMIVEISRRLITKTSVTVKFEIFMLSAPKFPESSREDGVILPGDCTVVRELHFCAGQAALGCTRLPASMSWSVCDVCDGIFGTGAGMAQFLAKSIPSLHWHVLSVPGVLDKGLPLVKFGVFGLFDIG